MQFTFPPADLVVKVVAAQWHWNYGYPKDAGGFAFDSYMKDDKELKPDDIRLLAVDNEAVVPVNKVIHLEVTSTDVIHSFIVQSFGVRIDAVPGRLNKIWFKADREGVYYGQCSKICGKDHAFMPIAFRVVSQDKYDAWVADAKKKYASVDNPVQVADEVVKRPRTLELQSCKAKPPTRMARTPTATRPAGVDTCFRPTTRTSALYI
jgi:cytochrome c oxidase subunit 2